MKQLIVVSILSLLSTGILYPKSARAEFSLKVTPAITQNHINFGQVEVNGVVTQEAEVKVTNDTSARYRLKHFLVEPLKNDHGDSLPSDQIKLFIRSNSRGTNLVDPVALQVGPIELYTSDDSGTSDTMTLAYTLFAPPDLHGGTYHGKITITLEPIDENVSVSVQSVTLDISYELRAIFQFFFSTESDEKRLDWGEISLLEKQEVQTDLLFETYSNLASRYWITEFLTEPVVNQETGESLPQGYFAVNFEGQGSFGVMPQSIEITKDPTTLYQSDAVGSSDRFIGHYQLKNLDRLSAGRYEGVMQFSIESDQPLPAGIQSNYLLPISFVVKSLFELIISPAEGDSLEFNEVDPLEVAERKLLVEIRSNRHQRYQLQQIAPQSLTSDSGETLPEGNLEVSVQETSSGGETTTLQGFQPVKSDNMILYTSNEKGDSTALTFVYRITVPRYARGGTYRTHLVFSLVVI